MITRTERLWACAAHIPFITIIWFSYLLYTVLMAHEPILEGLYKNFFTQHAIPITPLLLTLCSIPISLFIYHAQGKSSFVKEQAIQAYRFDISLLKWYGLSLIFILVGQYTLITLLTDVGFMVITFTSLNCFIQALLGIITVFNGKSYCYRYLEFR
jgi:hypothetical protein